ncbi:MAG: SPOR domain-containing protein [Methylococcales bacterium]
MTLLSKKLLPISLVLAGTVALAACSSKPSPWSESSSPWDGRAEQSAEPEPLAIDQIEPAYQEEETIEPIGFVAAEDNTAMVESEAMMEEPMMDPMSEPEPEQQMIEEPMMSVGGGLAAQPAGMFAVQVVASSSMDQLNFFARQNQLSDEWVAETMVDGKVWFVLMSGVYATKSDAEQALLGLQELGTDPWIRTVGSVQAVMSQ